MSLLHYCSLQSNGILRLSLGGTQQWVDLEELCSLEEASLTGPVLYYTIFVIHKRERQRQNPS
jgi:hypothetical protein